MNITQDNIVAYINFLFKRNNDVDAPKEILNSWKTLSNEEIQIHLKGLYQHWNIDNLRSDSMEQEFLGLSKGPSPIFDIPKPNSVSSIPHQAYQETPNNNQQSFQQPIVTTKKNTTSNIIIGVLAGIIIAGSLIWLNTKNDTQNNTSVVPTPSIETSTTVRSQSIAPATITTTVNEAIDTLASAATETVETETESTEQDAKNAQTIERLFEAEYSQNFHQIYKAFSPNVEKYWAINYPTEAELRNLYEKTWSKRTNIKHDDVSIQKVGPNQYNVQATYSAYDVEKQETIRRKVVTRFEMDSNNKIIKTYGL